MIVSTFADKLKQAKRPERVVPICLRGDLVAEFQAAERALEEALRNAGDSLAGLDTDPYRERIEAIQAEMREATEPFRVRALPQAGYRALVLAHPPRKQDGSEDYNPVDLRLGFNPDTFYPALVRACVAEPVITTEEWDALLGDDGALTEGQFNDLALAAQAVNRGEVDVPFSSVVSELTRRPAGE